MKTLSASSLCGLFVIATLASASAITSTSDTFTDGLKVGGSDNSGIAWYDRSANSDLTVDSTSAPNLTGNALNFNLGTGSVAGNTVNNRGFVGAFSTTFTPTNIGDSLTLSFDFQFRATPTAVLPSSTFTSAPQNASEGLTFGFFNSNGSPATADSSTESDNDFGIRGSFGSGATLSAALFRETNSAAGGLGTQTSSDSASFASTTTASAVNDFAKHNAQLTITLSSLGNYTVQMALDGNTIATGTTAVGTYTSFNELAFSQGGGNALSIDNVVVTVVPEPTSAALGALGLLALLRRRR